MKVKQDRLKLFVEALRSGEFVQTRGTLLSIGARYTKDPDVADAHCCLGVATVVAQRNGYAGPVNWELATLSEGVYEWYGFDRGDPKFSKAAVAAAGIKPSCKCCTDELSATSANDSARASFTQIADAFEHQYAAAA